MLDLGSTETMALPPRAAAVRDADGVHAVPATPPSSSSSESASPAARLVATALDVVLLAGIDVAIVSFTLQICGLSLDELALVPKAKQADFTSLIVQVDRRTMELRGLVNSDDTGSWTYRFQNLKENANLADKEFTFTPPRGVDIIR